MMERDDARTDPERRQRRDDYLWDKRGEPDETVSALEGALAGRRWRGELGDLAEMDATVDEGFDAGRDAATGPTPGARPLLRLLPRALAPSLAALLLVAVGLSVWHGVREPRGEPPAAGGGTVAGDPTPYRLVTLAGAPRVDGASVPSAGDLAMRPGASVVTDATSRARLEVGEIGSVELGPSSRLRLDAPSADVAPDADFLLHLDRGTLTASIFAAPRLFQLGTPSGIAVDMGCVYTAEVDEAGTTRLHVELGQVSFETERRKVLVPSGAGTRAWPGVGPGTPVWDDAPGAWAAAVERHDRRTLRDGAASDPETLAAVLATERREDSLTLWHLLAHADAAGAAGRDDAARVYDRLAALEPPPEGVTRAACLAGDRDALLAWRDVMGWAWPVGTSGKAGKTGKKGEKGG